MVEQLREHNIKLSDLEEALGQALDYVTQTEAINKENTANLQESEVLCSLFIISICEIVHIYQYLK